MRITVLGSGSSGNSTLVEASNTKILIDVGFSYRQTKEKLLQIGVSPSEIDYIFITHDHKDHISGLNVFLNNYNPYLCISKKISDIFFEKEYEKAIYYDKDFNIGNINISLIPLSHDATDGTGFVIECENESLVYITDTGYINNRYLPKLVNKTYYILESNHDIDMLLNGPYPKYLQNRILGDNGHLSNELCAIYLSKLVGDNTQKIVLAHLSKENNTPELALNDVKTAVNANDKEYNIVCASQDEILKVNYD